MVLSTCDSLVFARAPMDPPEPSERPLEAALRHKELIAEPR